MIFNTVVFYLAFLIPAAVVFRCTSGPARAWSSVAFGVAFFTYYSATQFGGWWGVACVLLFVWEGTFRSFYRPGGWACLAGVAVGVGVLVAFKYWNFLTGLAFAADNPVRWEGVFLPLGVSFFTFEFIHYAVDRYRGKVERGTAVMNGFAVSSGVAAVGTAGAVREEPLQSPVLARQRRPHL